MYIAHRGVWAPTCQNKVEHIRVANRHVGAVEVDVRYNSNKELVLCHDWKHRDDNSNNTFKELADVKEIMTILLDMKPRGIDEAVSMADEVCKIICDSHHKWELASFDERCVRRMMENKPRFPLGLISSGMTQWIDSIPDINFVSLDHDCVDECDIQHLRNNNIRVYLWTVDRWRVYPLVDGLIRNYEYSECDYNYLI